jgi:dihydroxyacetone kinase-like protein
MTTITPAQLADMLGSIARRILAERNTLNRLDAALGDGDHGTSISAALAAAVEDIAECKQPSAGDIWLTAAKAVMNRMGGASGAIFGTFFFNGGRFLRGKERVYKSDMEAVLQAGLRGVKARGKAEVGDKTMVDALAPAVKAFCAADEWAVAWRHAARAARAGAESTGELVARRGRAKYLGERAIGHIDPGAASIALIFEAVDNWWTETH